MRDRLRRRAGRATTYDAPSPELLLRHHEFQRKGRTSHDDRALGFDSGGGGGP